MRTAPIAHAILALALCAASSACGPKLVREDVFERDDVVVQLRHRRVDGAPLDRGYGHPSHIADVRLAHILASITHDDRDQKRGPTLRSEVIYDLAEGIALALTRATPADEVIALARGSDRRLRIFTSRAVTAFRVTVRSDELVIEFYDVERKLESSTGAAAREAYEIPAELPKSAPDFELIPGRAQRRAGARGLAVAWRDEHYRKPVSLRFRSGRVRRRSVLIAPEEEAAGAATTADPRAVAEAEARMRAGFSDAQLRAMDQLEAARRAGLVREDEYQRRRRLIRSDRLEEAGYARSPGPTPQSDAPTEPGTP